MKVLIFDFDGTIADSFETMLEIFDEIHARPQKLTTREIQELRGESLKQITKYLKIKSWQMPRLVLKAKRLLGLRMDDIQTFPGLPAALDRLYQQNHQMYILSTNSRSNITLFLKNNEMEGYFTGIYGDIGLRSKSSALKRIIRKEKLKLSNCAYIGDEVRDIEAARKAGITAAGVTWGFNNANAIKSAQPDILVQKPQDLLKIT